MKTKILSLITFALINASALHAISGNDSFLAKKRDEKKILINNRILAKPNGKPVSTYDLMKKMDLSFLRHFPEYSTSPEARLEYYQVTWKDALFDLIDKQLILADAKESKIEVSSGDVRQEIELAFGPNTIANLDKAGFTYEEAFKMVQEEILIRRLVAGRAHVKAIRLVTPNKIRLAYEEFIQDPANFQQPEWTYRTVTIKERNLEKTEQTAKVAHQFLLEGTPIDKLEEKLKNERILGRQGKITISNTIKQQDNEVSKDYKQILVTLDKGMYSQPFLNKSRATGSKVFRILAVEDKTAGGYPSYKEMESKLKDQLLDKEIDRETNEYLIRLRDHYHIRQSDIEAALPPNYQPFTLN